MISMQSASISCANWDGLPLEYPVASDQSRVTNSSRGMVRSDSYISESLSAKMALYSGVGFPFFHNGLFKKPLFGIFSPLLGRSFVVGVSVNDFVGLPNWIICAHARASDSGCPITRDYSFFESDRQRFACDPRLQQLLSGFCDL